MPKFSTLSENSSNVDIDHEHEINTLGKMLEYIKMFISFPLFIKQFFIVMSKILPCCYTRVIFAVVKCAT